MRGEGVRYAEWKGVKELAKGRDEDRTEAGAVIHRALSPAPSYWTPIIMLYIISIYTAHVTDEGLRLSYVTTCPSHTVNSRAQTLTWVLLLSPVSHCKECHTAVSSSVYCNLSGMTD